MEKIIRDFELHSVEGIKECFENGVHPNDAVKMGDHLFMN